MKEFEVLKLSKKSQYWYEVFKFVSPFATVGSFILDGLSLWSEYEQQKRLEEISKKIDKVSEDIRASRRAIERQIYDVEFKKLAAGVCEIEEALEEQTILRNPDILSNTYSRALGYKHQILKYITASEIPDDFLFSYSGLYTILIPLRIAIFGHFDVSKKKIKKLIIDENKDRLKIRNIAISCAERVGGRRVSSVKKTIPRSPSKIFETDLEPLFEPGIDFSEAYFLVDGKLAAHGVVVDSPKSKPTSLIFRDRDTLFSEMAKLRYQTEQEIAAQVAKPFKDYFSSLEKEMKILHAEEPVPSGGSGGARPTFHRVG